MHNVALAGIGLFASTLLVPALSAQVFGPVDNRPLPAGSLAATVAALGDLDHDGAPDLVLLDVLRLSVQRGVGNGSPAPAYSVAVPGAVFAGTLQLVDGNGDGNLDIWVGHTLGVTELRGDGTGAFPSAVNHPASNRAFCVIDVNGDHCPDFVVGGLSGLEVALGLGGGAFASPLLVPSTPAGPAWMCAGDVDADGDVDLVLVGGLGADIGVMLGDGTGHFAPAGPVIHGGLIAYRARLADVNEDGLADLILASPLLSVYLSQGAGLFGPAIVVSPIASSVREVVAVDADADGHIDLLRPEGLGIAMLRGDGAGGFAAPSPFATQIFSNTMAAGDVDADGRIDVMTANASTIALLRNQIATPAGITAFGSGTPACGGTIGMWGTPRPAIGETGFHVVCSNAPPESFGLLALGTKVAAGWDPLGIGLTLHLGLPLPIATMRSDASGAARHSLPIPAVPWLVGLRVEVQSVWLADPGRGDTCSPAQFDFASSRGLTITLQP
jgi:hypothetical protein